MAYPGVAKFGIALEWGSRGRWFESSHSDQGEENISVFLSFLFSEQRTSGLLGGKAAFNCRLWADARSAADPLVRIQSLGPRRGKRFCFPLFSFFGAENKISRLMKKIVMNLCE